MVFPLVEIIKNTYVRVSPPFPTAMIENGTRKEHY